MNSFTAIDQTKFGKPDGNCFAACVASIFGLSIDDIPEFDKISGEHGWWFHFLNWCDERGLVVHHGAGLDLVPANTKYIASGMAVRGLEHSVVYENGKLIHDPHPSRAGLVPIDVPRDFMYFVEQDKECKHKFIDRYANRPAKEKPLFALKVCHKCGTAKPPESSA